MRRLEGVDETSDGSIGDGGAGAGVSGQGVQRSGRAGGAGGAGGQGRKTGGEGGRVQEGWQLRVNSDGTIVLKVTDFKVKTLDLSVELRESVSMRGQNGYKVRVALGSLTRFAAFSLRLTFSSWMV